ncbi:hypothetical protein [Flavobacterium sp. HJSW_4]|uniref:hypothetical protein n=1 Tax=Flavobacterium sp. HJSW_4 TaxID=3344660 RepID=UPI0035F29109
MEKQIINIGSLINLSNLNYHLGKELNLLRESYIIGNGKIPVWDMRNIPPKNASISALTAFLGISKTIRDFIGQPIEVLAFWQPEFQGFLSDIGFLRIAHEFDLYDWKGMLGGYDNNKTSITTKIFYYSDVPNIDYNNQSEIIDWKDTKRQEIKHSIHFRLNNIFNSKIFHDNWNKNLESVFTITLSELVVNSLLHGREIAFVAVQRTKRGISTVVCDSGRGFLRSMKDTKSYLNENLENSNLKALLISSLQSKNKIGLYRAIDDIILSDGYVIMSSFDGEILWKQELWKKAKTTEGAIGIDKISIDSIGNYTNGFVDTRLRNEGYFKKYEDFLVGSRITFEIPF